MPYPQASKQDWTPTDRFVFALWGLVLALPVFALLAPGLPEVEMQRPDAMLNSYEVQWQPINVSEIDEPIVQESLDCVLPKVVQDGAETFYPVVQIDVEIHLEGVHGSFQRVREAKYFSQEDFDRYRALRDSSILYLFLSAIAFLVSVLSHKNSSLSLATALLAMGLCIAGVVEGRRSIWIAENAEPTTEVHEDSTEFGIRGASELLVTVRNESREPLNSPPGDETRVWTLEEWNEAAQDPHGPVSEALATVSDAADFRPLKEDRFLRSHMGSYEVIHQRALGRQLDQLPCNFRRLDDER